MKKLYIGNLPFSATDDEVREMFEKHGTVNEVTLIRNRESGQLRGFGFVEMELDDADTVISAMDGMDYKERNIKVNLAKEREGSGKGGGRRQQRDY